MRITDERLTAFINSLDTGNPAYLNELEKEARETNVPIIRTETQSLLRTLIAVNRPERILEVGTAVGFSALCMSEYAPEGCQITTIEKYEKRIPVALENFRRCGKSGCIQLLAEDAAVALKKLKGSYDFIFMDAAKGQYMNFLPDVLRLLRTGGLMVSDNVLQDGGYPGIPVCGDQKGQNHTCADAGISLRAEAQSSSGDLRAAGRGRSGRQREGLSGWG